MEEAYLSHGIIRVRLGSRWGVFRADGSEFLPVSYDEISLYRFNGMEENWVLKLKQDGKHGIASFANPQLVPAVYDEPVDQTGLLFVVKLEGKYGALDMSGRKQILKFMYDGISHKGAADGCLVAIDFYELLQRDDAGYNRTLFDLNSGTFSDVYKEIAYFSDGYCKVRKDSLYGYLDCMAKPAFPIRFQEVSDQTCGGKAIVRQNGKYGIIDMQGNFVLAPTLVLEACDFLRSYKEERGCNPVENRLLFITRDEKGRRRYGVIDHQGKVLIPAIYNFIEMETVQDQLIQVRLGENYGLLNLSGEIRIPIDSSFITGHDLPGVYKVMPAHMEVLMDCYGNMAVP